MQNAHIRLILSSHVGEVALHLLNRRWAALFHDGEVFEADVEYSGWALTIELRDKGEADRVAAALTGQATDPEDNPVRDAVPADTKVVLDVTDIQNRIGLSSPDAVLDLMRQGLLPFADLQRPDGYCWLPAEFDDALYSMVADHGLPGVEVTDTVTQDDADAFVMYAQHVYSTYRRRMMGELLTADQVCDLTGLASPESLRTMMRAGHLPLPWSDAFEPALWTRTDIMIALARMATGFGGISDHLLTPEEAAALRAAAEKAARQGWGDAP